MEKQPPPLLFERRLDEEYIGIPDEELCGLSKRALDALIAADPDDLKIRVFLLRQGMRDCMSKKKNSSARLFDQLTWFMEHMPDALCLFEEVTLLPDYGWDFIPEFKQICIAAMDKAELAGNRDLLIEYNIAHMFSLVDKEWCIEILRKCYAEEPESEEWPLELAALCLFEESFRDEGVDFALQALALHQIYPRPSCLEQNFSMELSTWFDVALEHGRIDACRTFADAVLTRKDSHPQKWKSEESALYESFLKRISLS